MSGPFENIMYSIEVERMLTALPMQQLDWETDAKVDKG
jgi:hypothetical protein